MAVSKAQISRNFTRFGVRTRLLIGFLSIAGITLLTSLMVFLEFGEVRSDISAITEQQVPALETVLRMQTKTRTIGAISSGLMASRDEGERKRLIAELQSQWRQILLLIADARRLKDGERPPGGLMKGEVQRISSFLENMPILDRITGSWLRARITRQDLSLQLGLLNAATKDILREPIETLAAEIDRAETAAGPEDTGLDGHISLLAAIGRERTLKRLESDAEDIIGALFIVATTESNGVLNEQARFLVNAYRKLTGDAVALKQLPENRAFRAWHAQVRPLIFGRASLVTARRSELRLENIVEGKLATQERTAKLLEVEANRLIEISQGTINQLSVTANSRIREGYWVLIFAVALSFAGAVLIVATYVDRKIISPLMMTSSAMRTIAGGTTEVTLPKRTDDELGDMVRSLEVLRKYVERVLTTEAELRVKTEEANAASKAKSAFLASMSHEIRTPMNGVLAMVEILESGKLNPEQREIASVIHESATSLLGIINDILDFSKIEANKMVLEEIDISLCEVVESTVELLAPKALERGLEMSVFVDPGLQDSYLGDPTRIQQILWNLIGNAVKFTQAGFVRIEVDRHTGIAVVPAGMAPVRIRVSDSGIGMDKSEQAQLFQSFHQADQSIARKFGGTGLGLAICGRLLNLMRGSISVTSTKGQGTVFDVFMPLKPSGEKDRHPGFNLQDCHVLLAGTRDPVGRDLAAYLDHLGATVDRQEEIAPAAGDNADYDLIVVDYDQRPEKRGMFLQKVKSSLKLKEMRALFLSGGADDLLTGFAGNHAGMDILHKPCLRTAFWHSVGGLLERGGRKGGHKVPQEATQFYSAPERDAARTEGALILIAEDNSTNRTVICQQLHKLGYVADIVDDGKEALARLSENEYGLLLTDCHMPVMDGYQLTGSIRESEAESGARLPIVALTADAIETAEKGCLDAGMDDYLCKPVNLRQLDDVIRKWLPRAAELRQVQPEESVAASAPQRHGYGDIPREILDVSNLVEIYGELNQSSFSLLDVYSKTAEALLDKLSSSVAANDWKSTKEAVHELKGSSGNIGAVKIMRLSEKLYVLLAREEHGDVERRSREIEFAYGEFKRLLAALRQEYQPGTEHRPIGGQFENSA